MQIKTGKRKPIVVVPAKGWRICPFQSLFCQLVCTAGNADTLGGLDFICNEMHTGSSPSAKVSAGIQSFKTVSPVGHEIDAATTAKVRRTTSR
jgi:hypothetical protein